MIERKKGCVDKMNRNINWCCSKCQKPILANDLIAWTKKETLVHLICDASQLMEGVHYIGRAEQVMNDETSDQRHA